MALYKVIINKSVRKKDLPKIPKKYIQRIVLIIGSLADNPKPAGCLKLTNREEYRIRVGTYRILYIIDDIIQIVEVTNVKHRSSVY